MIIKKLNLIQVMGFHQKLELLLQIILGFFITYLIILT